VGTNLLSVAIGDFNGDGRSDLAVANFSSNNFSILLNSTAWSRSIHASQVAALHLQNRYELILLDLQMPLMNGFEVPAGLRKTKGKERAHPGDERRSLSDGSCVGSRSNELPQQAVPPR
jgi:CheY-like chemotaxis protein